MKRTSEDDAYALKFSIALRGVYDSKKREGITDEQFAQSIGVARAQLDRYLRGDAVPSVRTVALCLREHGVAVAYAGIDITEGVRKGVGSPRRSSTRQLILPLKIQNEGPSELKVKLRPVSRRSYELQFEWLQKLE